jgi:hypothetical protein
LISVVAVAVVVVAVVVVAAVVDVVIEIRLNPEKDDLTLTGIFSRVTNTPRFSLNRTHSIILREIVNFILF